MKNIVITGANRGIGLELTKLFATEHTVYALCRSDFPEDALNNNIKIVKLDITDESAVESFVERLNKDRVAIDLLINNAGTDGRGDDGESKLDTRTVTGIFATNTVGPMILSLYLLDAMKRSEHPVMIAVSSRMGTHAMLDSYNASQWPYSASKAGLSFAVSAFAINEPEVKWISVHPGWVKTRMGGQDADISTTESATGIKKLYDNIDSFKSGGMYNYDGSVMDW